MEAKRVITFPEPEWKELEERDLLYFKDRFVDNTAWELVAEYWKIKATKSKDDWSGREYAVYHMGRQPVFPFYNRKEIKGMIKEVMEEAENGRGSNKV